MHTTGGSTTTADAPREGAAPRPSSTPPPAGGPSRKRPPGELPEEARLSGSETARCVNAALLALSRTARCFTLYDASNHAVREFLDDLRRKLARALQAVDGPLELEVRPFELALGREVVYLERERERSLAFRLHRDGVRRLRLQPGMQWEEILGLVEILSVRYTSVRQQEDDLVTLLAKAEFPHVSFVAVEGFVPDQEEAEEGAVPMTVAPVEPPADWDLPLPELGGALPLAYRALPDPELARLRAEPDDEAQVRDCVDLTLELLDRLADERQAMVEEDVEGFVFEVRDFLLAEGRLDALLELVPALERSSAGDLRPRPSILARFGGKEPLRRLADGIRRRGGPPPSEAARYLHAVPGQPLLDLLDLLLAERDPAMREALTALVAELAEDRPGLLLERMETADGETARLLLQALGRAVPEQAVEAALRLKDRKEPSVQLAALATLAGAPFTPTLGRALSGLLSSPHPEVRAAAIDGLAGGADPRAYEALLKHALGGAGRGLSVEEAERLGEALARQDPKRSLGLFVEWLQPHSLLQRMVEGPAERLLHRIAVAGLAQVPGNEAETRLRSFLDRSTGEMHQLCLNALLTRRRGSREAAGALHA